MRSGTRRGVMLAIALTTTLILVPTLEVRADGGWWHTIPREVPAVDYRTGDIMMAPPIPYGEYTKDYIGGAHAAAGMAAGAVHGLIGKVCGLCGGAACGACGGLGHAHGGGDCGSCGGDGCGHCGSGLLGHGSGLFGGLLGGHKLGHGSSGACGVAGCGVGGIHQHAGLSGKRHGIGGLIGHDKPGHGGLALCGGPGQPPCASSQGQVIPSGQLASAQAASHPCGRCGGLGLLGAKSCGLCGGGGLLGGLGGSCGGCGGRGLLGGTKCGGCDGLGMLSGLKNACGACGGLGHLQNGRACGACGGSGLLGHLAGLPHHLLGAVHGAAASVFHVGDIKYFVGPGGPVPLTPGYVPYVVPTRSPRDYFAFPPYVDRAMP